MVKNKLDLRYFLEQDFSKYPDINKKCMLIELLKGNLRAYYIYKFIKTLRILELYENNRERSIFHKIAYLIYKFKHQRLQFKTQIFIHTNVFGPGLYIAHPGFCWAGESSLIGKNCSILPKVLLGKKHNGVKGKIIIIGDDCYIGTGVTILGPVTIGNNVTIAANSLVNKDIPDNCIVAGVPAKIIKFKI